MGERDCYTCANNARIGALPPNEDIEVRGSWRLAHAFGTSLPGWLVAVPTRHVTALDELEPAEAGQMGEILQRASKALREVFECEKAYFVFFAEQEGFGHLHVHVIPRMPWFTAEQRGPGVFSFLGRSAQDTWLPDDERDRIALMVRAALAREFLRVASGAPGYPRAVLEPDEVLGFIEGESAAVAAAIAPSVLEVRVPSCPDWSFAELIWHLGRVQRFWAVTVRGGGADPVRPAEEPIPKDAGELERWFGASTRELLDALQTVSREAPAWTWWKDDRTVGAIARHQVQEAAVHRWDAQNAVGVADPLPPNLADDGVDEFLWVARQMRGPEPIAFHATDTGTIFSAGHEPADITVSAPASDLVLLLYSRLTPDDVEVSGDRAALDAFLVPIG